MTPSAIPAHVSHLRKLASDASALANKLEAVKDWNPEATKEIRGVAKDHAAQVLQLGTVLVGNIRIANRQVNGDPNCAK